MRFRPWYSQHGEDQWIAANLSLPARGYFVEVGAGDGVEGSNTLHFEQWRGWSGLAIEANPADFLRLVHSDRTCKAEQRAAGRVAGEADFVVHPTSGWSGLARPVEKHTRRVKVRVETLTQILIECGAPPVIDLLSIDTEGTELDVWAGLDRELFRPRIVIVEFDTAGLRCDPAGVAAAFVADGYDLRHSTAANHILTKEASQT